MLTSKKQRKLGTIRSISTTRGDVNKLSSVEVNKVNPPVFFYFFIFWVHMDAFILKLKQFFGIVNNNKEIPKDETETETELPESKTIIEEKVRY